MEYIISFPHVSAMGCLFGVFEIKLAMLFCMIGAVISYHVMYMEHPAGLDDYQNQFNIESVDILAYP